MRALVVAALMGLASTQVAEAQRIPLNAASAFSLTTGDGSCSLTLRDPLVSGQPAIVTRDCDASSPEGFVWLFRWVPGMPLTGTVSIDLEAVNLETTAARNSCIKVSLGCSSASSSTVSSTALTYGTATTACDDYPFSITDYTVKTFTGVALPSTVAQDRWCGLKVERDATNVSDTDTLDWVVRGGALKW